MNKETYQCQFCCSEFESDKLGKGAVPVCPTEKCQNEFWKAYNAGGSSEYFHKKSGQYRWPGRYNEVGCD